MKELLAAAESNGYLIQQFVAAVQRSSLTSHISSSTAVFCGS